MSLPVDLTDEAAADFDSAADWYEDQAGQGAKFTTRVREAPDRIGAMPEQAALIHRDIRRVRVLRFPYNIYYWVRVNRVEVIAVCHGRRDPLIWKSRA